MGAPCPSNITTFTDDPLSTDIEIKSVHVTELRTSINNERQRRSDALITWSRAVSSGDDIVHTDVKELYTSTDSIESGIAWDKDLSNLSSGNEIDIIDVQEIRDTINQLSQECVCDCNYCTCNCNYCTCNCNYCTCNCNYNCTCVCAYSCTCNCNYSCTCDCNYCTCDCNYCTCDCDYCTCDCDYSCTCVCDYSCTCVCNYCTCDCNYCTCNCNYNCTCQCHY